MGIKIKRKNKQKNHKNIILLYIYYFLGKIETCFSVINLHIWTYISTHPHLSTASHTHSIADCLNPWICFVLANWEQSELKTLQWINSAVIRAVQLMAASPAEEANWNPPVWGGSGLFLKQSSGFNANSALFVGFVALPQEIICPKKQKLWSLYWRCNKHTDSVT